MVSTKFIKYHSTFWNLEVMLIPIKKVLLLLSQFLTWLLSSAGVVFDSESMLASLMDGIFCHVVLLCWWRGSTQILYSLVLSRTLQRLEVNHATILSSSSSGQKRQTRTRGHDLPLPPLQATTRLLEHRWSVFTSLQQVRFTYVVLWLDGTTSSPPWRIPLCPCMIWQNMLQELLMIGHDERRFA